MLSDLIALRNKHGADKPDHYLSAYALLLGHKRQDHVRLVEVGVHRGGSLRMWREFFPNAMLYGIDIDPQCKGNADGIDRCEVFTFDQADRPALRQFIEITGGKFDFVIDDGGHTVAQQLATFDAFWPEIIHGGFYFLEDIGTSYWANCGGADIGADGTAIAMVKSLVDSVNYFETTEEAAVKMAAISAVTPKSRVGLRRDVFSLHFVPSMAVIQRHAP